MLSEEERTRYRRQLIMPEIGEAGQERIKASTVMIAGLGGLGSVTAFYLAAAGVGRLKLVDMDQVAVHNLNRQILHLSTDVGRLKVDSARAKLAALNPWCRIEILASRIDSDSVDEMARGCDLIMDGTDNIGTRRILNRVSLSNEIPYIFGAVGGFDGMLSSFIPGRTACLECLFPDGTAETAEETGVIGPAAGVIASLQTMEALKILSGQEPGLAGTLMHFHGSSMRLKKTAIDPNPDCRRCSSK